MTQEFVTLPRSVVEQAMSALEFSETQSHRHQYDVEASALSALSAALEQPPTIEQPQGEQEPVAWIENLGGGIGYNPYHEAAQKLPDGVRFDLYTSMPAKREPLKNEWIRKIESGTHFHESPCWVIRFARAIEAAHNIK